MKTALKIKSREEAKQQVDLWKQAGKKVVFTNGCFDLLHLGHIDYLEKAQALGDVLVIGLNTDRSVKQLKGPNRPINSEEERARLLAALSFVDLVVFFKSETPRDLITFLLPDILVKGSDYEVEHIVGSQEVINNGGEVKTLAFITGYSTSSLIEKIKR